MEKKTYIALILDESGSMAMMDQAAIDLFNGQRREIRALRKLGGKTRVSFYKFGGDPIVERVFSARKTKKVPKLTVDTYTPQNMTPMLDAMGMAITDLKKLDDGGRDTAFLVVMITDGMENFSKEWSSAQVKKSMDELTATGRWTFSVFGANVNWDTLCSAGISVPHSNFVQYKPTTDGLAAAGETLSVSTMSYMSSRDTGATASKTFGSDGLKKGDGDLVSSDSADMSPS